MANDETELESKIEAGNMDDPDVEVPTPGRRIAHYHPADRRASQIGPMGDETTVGRQKREPCYQTVYNVACPGGLRINEKLYLGRVTVPECVANYLSTMDRDWQQIERDLYRNRSVSKNFNV